MNNFQYQNIDEIINSNNPIRGSRFFVRRDKRIIVPEIITETSEELNQLKDQFELHLFHNDTTYIGSRYDINNWDVDNLLDPDNIYLNVLENIQPFDLQNGRYRLVYNFFRNLVGSSDSRTKLFISEISQDRRELVLALTDPTDSIQVINLTTFVLEYLKPKKYLPSVVLNFGENKILDVINVTSDGSQSYFYVKLMFPLPDDLDLRFECWLGIQLLKPYIDQFDIRETIETSINKQNVLRGPNYNANYKYNMVSETDYKSWTDLLSTNVNTSQEILSKFVNGNKKPVRLNIDFSKFANFCFYSSAVDRLKNFFYKIQLIETYRLEIDNLKGYMASSIDIDNNINKITKLIEKLIDGFDEWEKWLYFEESPSDTSIVETNNIVPYPKYEVNVYPDITTKSGKYKFYTTDQGIAISWYEATLVLAEEFDSANTGALIKALPDHITTSPENKDFLSFVNMIGQHFDIIYTYTNHILSKNLRKENPKSGLSQDLIQEVTEHFGWKLASNTQDKNIWEYALGLDENEENKDNVLGKKYNKTEEERSKEVWRRVLNNLPYIYKTKGTSRGINALLAAYGIPQTLLSIREYGGSYNENSYDFGKKLYNKATYYLNINGYNSQSFQSITTPWEKVKYNNEFFYPDSVSFRWKMEPEKLYSYSGSEIQTVLQKSSSNGSDWFVTINNNGTDIEKGSITFYITSESILKSASIYDDYLFDNIPLNILIKRSSQNDDIYSNQVYDFILKTEKYGKLVIEKSASIVITGSQDFDYNNSWSSNGTLYVGSGINQISNNAITGSIFELRYWSNPLSEKSFNNHVLAARSYNGNTSTSSFYDLQAQWKFWQPFNLEATNSLLSFHPNQKNNNFEFSPKIATLLGFTTNSFEAIEESYLMEIANIGTQTDFGQKIRIESSSLGGALNMHNSYERTSLKRNSVDSNRLTVAFSPQHIINEDIYEALGRVDIGEYIGDYRTLESDEYTDLKMFANEYWQKYDNRNDFNAYISIISKFDFSVFEQIAQTLPVRSNEILGLVIEPNILERSKTLSVKKISGNVEDYKESNDISIFPNLKKSINDQKNTVLLIGFEDGDTVELDVIEEEFDIETNISTETDEIIKEGEYDIDIDKKGEAINKRIKIKVFDWNNEENGFGNIKLNYKAYGSLLKTSLTDNNIVVKSNTYPINLNVKNSSNIIGNRVNIDGYVKLNLGFTNDNKSISISGSYVNSISNYEKNNYYDTIYPINDLKYLRNNGYTKVSGSFYLSPNSLDISKRNRDFFGCNDYPHPYRKLIKLKSSILSPIQDPIQFVELYENFDRPNYFKNNKNSIKYNDVNKKIDLFESNNYILSENDIFPVSDFWKTDIKGQFLTDNINKNQYGMKDSAPRIIHIDTGHPDLLYKNLFTTYYLQESVIGGTKKYLNYPTSQQYVRSFPWVLTWSGSNENMPNLGPDYGFTSMNYVNLANVVVPPGPVFPQIQ